MNYLSKGVLFVAALALAMASVGPIAAHSGDDLTLDQMLQQMYEAQGVSRISDIDCEKIDDHTLEDLGDAFMSVVHPDPDVHEAMDQMMGGEGSESLRFAHIRMGQSYLGCSGGSWYGPMMGSATGYGMMGSGMMGYNYSGKSWDMMGQGSWGSSAWTFMSVFWISLWILIVLGIILLIIKLANQVKKQ